MSKTRSVSKVAPKQIIPNPKGYGGTKNNTYIRPQSK